jgi:hypothetical protein
VTQQEDFQEAYEALTAVNNKLETM